MASGTDTAKKFLKELSGKKVSVGWFPGNQYAGTETPVAFVAYINEYGGKRGKVEIPARAPMRTTMDTRGSDITDAMAKLVSKGIAGNLTPDQVMNQLGLFAQSAVQETIGSNLAPPNAVSTVEGMLLWRRNPKTGEREQYRAGSAQKENRTFGQGKGFNRTLIDTGQMSQTVSYLVE